MAKKTYEDDDGRVVTSMNVEGMPWYRKVKPDYQNSGNESLTGKQTARVILSATLAALLVGLVLCAGLVGLVAFLIWVW